MNQNHWRWSAAIIVMSLIFGSCSIFYGGLFDSAAVYFLTGFLSWYLPRDDSEVLRRLVMSVSLLGCLTLLTIYFSHNEWLSQLLKDESLIKLIGLQLVFYLAGMGLAHRGEVQKQQGIYRKFK
jgi:hypothetical protein